MASTMLTEFTAFFETEAAPDGSMFDFSTLDGFGIMDSHQYRALYLKLAKKNGFTMLDHVMLFILVNQVKSRDRLMDSRGMEKTEFKTKYGKEAWFTRIADFLKKDCCMYVAEKKKVTGMSGKFPLVNINTAWPTMAFVAFCYILHGRYNVSAMSETDIQSALLEDKNTWLVQMHLDDAAQNLAKISNQKFWESTVQKSANPVAGAYEGSKGANGGYFNQNYYKTQSEDTYPFATITAGRFTLVNGMQSMSDIVDIVKNFKA